MWDWTNRFVDLEGGRPEIAVFALASIEQHGAHLPVGTDYFIGQELSRLVAEALGAYLLPTWPVVSAWEHAAFRGSVSLTGLTVRRLIGDIVRSLYEGGFRKVVVINTHGGNWMIKPAVIELNRRYEDLMLIYAGGDLLAYRGKRPVRGELHAGAGEVSLILDLRPETVRRPLQDHVPEETPASHLDYVGVKGVSPSGVWGRGSEAEPGRGHATLLRRARTIADEALRAFAQLEALAREGEGAS